MAAHLFTDVVTAVNHARDGPKGWPRHRPKRRASRMRRCPSHTTFYDQLINLRRDSVLVKDLGSM